MYQHYFGLAEAPFSIAPDPRYLYLSQRHQEALAHLLYGVNSDGGFVLLTGDVGAGKTTVCRCLLQQIPASCNVAYIFNPQLTVGELLSTICVEFGIAFPPGNVSVKVFVHGATVQISRQGLTALSSGGYHWESEHTDCNDRAKALTLCPNNVFICELAPHHSVLYVWTEMSGQFTSKI